MNLKLFPSVCLMFRFTDFFQICLVYLILAQNIATKLRNILHSTPTEYFARQCAMFVLFIIFRFLFHQQCDAFV